MADNSAVLRAAARRRSQSARQRTLEAIAMLTSENQAVTPTSVARRAGVSRQWLYTVAEALDAIRNAPKTGGSNAVPVEQRASVVSLRRRIEVLADENSRLRQRVEELEHRLAGAYGAMRASRT